jgi:hypothetical protein
MNHLVPVTDGGAANLFIGTYLPGDGTLFGVKKDFAAKTRLAHPRLRRAAVFRLPQEFVLDAVAAQHSGATRDDRLRTAAVKNLHDYAWGRPMAFAGMEVRKLWRMWSRPYGGTFHPPGAALIWLHRVLVLAALAGLAAGVLRLRDARLLAVAAFLALVTAVDVAFVSEPRHNVRLMPVLLAAGAAGAWAALRRRPAGAQVTANPSDNTAPTTTQ